MYVDGIYLASRHRATWKQRRDATDGKETGKGTHETHRSWVEQEAKNNSAVMTKGANEANEAECAECIVKCAHRADSECRMSFGPEGAGLEPRPFLLLSDAMH